MIATKQKLIHLIENYKNNNSKKVNSLHEFNTIINDFYCELEDETYNNSLHLLKKRIEETTIYAKAIDKIMKGIKEEEALRLFYLLNKKY